MRGRHRSGRETDRLIIARLSGTATRHTHDHTDHADAIAELVAIATTRAGLRTDLLDQAAGSLLGGWQHSCLSYWSGRDAALLLVHAGADPDRVKEIAALTRKALRTAAHAGIGHSQ